MPMIKNNALIHELYDLLVDIGCDAEEAADIAVNIEDEDGFREMITFLNENPGTTKPQAHYESAMIWQSKHPEELMDDDEEYEEMTLDERARFDLMTDAIDNHKVVRIEMNDGSVYPCVYIIDFYFADRKEEFFIKAKGDSARRTKTIKLNLDDVISISVI